MVTGVILLGLATPTEAAATGALGCYILTAIYRRLNWELVKKSIGGTVQVTVMMFMVIMGATAFAQILVFSKASQGLLEFTLGLPISPSLIIIAMMVVVLIMGCFMDTVAIMMITIPIFVPVVNSLGFSPVWFGVMYLINIEIGMISPPFGYILFVMKGVAPSDTTMGDIYWAGLPFLVCELIAMGLVFAFPPIALWLPSVMR
jgi:tripartite ATP-independent transporter DctM subunit